MTITPLPEDAEAQKPYVFHFGCLGNFSGSQMDREQLLARPLDSNHWQGLFQSLKPCLEVSVALPEVSDLRLKLCFEDFGHFSERQLPAVVPELAALVALEQAISQASEEQTLDGRSFVDRPGMRTWAQIIERSSATPDRLLDLLSMVSIDENSLQTPLLRQLLQNPSYEGQRRSALLAEMGRLRNLVVESILKDPQFIKLKGLWYGLRKMVQSGSAQAQWHLVDCHKGEICDAFWLLFVKPEEGSPQPLDAACCLEPLGHEEQDRDITYHLGRMAASLSVPIILETDPGLFSLKTWNHASHIPDLAERLKSPALTKWRKLKEIEGAAWTFMAMNPLMWGHEEGKGALVPAGVFVASLLAEACTAGRWPGDMTLEHYTIDGELSAQAKLSDAQAKALSFAGFCALAADNGRMRLLGMNNIAPLKHTAGAPSAQVLAPFSLAYRFFCGCLGRFLLDLDGGNLPKQIALFADCGSEEITLEQDDGGRWLRVCPGFTVWGEKPEVILEITQA